MDKLELKFFDNIKRFKNSKDFKSKFEEEYKICSDYQIQINYKKELNQGYTKINNFFEFYVNDVPLSQILDKFFNNSETLLNNQNGQIGYYKNSFNFDKLVINSFLKKPITSKDLSVFSKEGKEEWFLDFVDEQNKAINEDAFFRFYICSVCGDGYCHLTLGKVIKNEKTFSWIFENFKEETLKFEFDSDSYIKVFNDYLK